MNGRIKTAFLIVLCNLLVFTSCKKAPNVIDNLPQNGVYSNVEGMGGSYKDPIHGFFVVEPPVGFEIVERRDKKTVTIETGRPRAGEEVPRSWIQFNKSNVEIGAIARQTWTDFDTDFKFVMDSFENKGAKIQFKRYITIDGVKGGEYIVEISGIMFHGIKYKKHGLDHSLSLGGSPREYRRYQNEFLSFARSYRSIKSE